MGSKKIQWIDFTIILVECVEQVDCGGGATDGQYPRQPRVPATRLCPRHTHPRSSRQTPLRASPFYINTLSLTFVYLYLLLIRVYLFIVFIVKYKKLKYLFFDFITFICFLALTSLPEPWVETCKQIRFY